MDGFHETRMKGRFKLHHTLLPWRGSTGIARERWCEDVEL